MYFLIRGVGAEQLILRLYKVTQIRRLVKYVLKWEREPPQGYVDAINHTHLPVVNSGKVSSGK